MTFDQIMQSENFIPNLEQRPIIESVCNTVVSAGAGAGKTAVLSWRFLRLVMEQNVRPDQILTLTFTKKAANEMSQRIYQRLLKAKDSLSPDVLDNFRSATISTLDSFCAQIVRSDSTAYGFPRDFSNLSDQDLATLAERVAMRFLSDPENEQERNLIASLAMPSNVMDRFFGRIATLSNIAGNYDAERISGEFLSDIRRIYEDKRARLGEMLDVLGQMNLKGAFANQYAKIRYSFDNECLSDDDYFSLTGVKDDEVKGQVAEIRTILDKNKGFALLQDLSKGPCETSVLQRAVEKYTALLNAEKRRLGSLTFSDVSELAVCILRDNLQLRRVYKERFRFVMIDEFQDNNSLQRDLLFLLSEKLSVDGEVGRIPNLEELDPDKLFFVGDEKQSIYSFRGADVSVFRRLQSDIGRNGDSLSLSTNYRSQEKLIRHFNDVFEKVLSDGEMDFQARYTPILCGRKSDGTESRIIFATYDKKGIEDEEMDGGILEAEAIGDYCQRALYTDEFLVAGKRPEPEDIAIIFRSSTNQMNIEKSLKRRGIDYQIAETRSLMLDAVSSDFYCILNLLLYPEDTRSLAAALKSPFCGLCEQSIFNVLLKGEEVLPVDRRRYELFQAFMVRLRERAFRLTLSELVRFIYMEGGYRAYLDSTKDRSTFEEHFEYLFSYAASFDKDGKGLNDYVAFLRENLGTSSKLPETAVLHKSRQGVQIMTVHKSKGLEFKVVIFAGLGNSLNRGKENLVFDYGGNLVASENKGIRKILDDDYKDRETAESKRLMYVAMTRAMDHLILIGGYSTKKMTETMQWYIDAIGANLVEQKCSNPDVILEDVTDTVRMKAPATETVEFPEAPKEFTSFRTKEQHISVTQMESLLVHPFRNGNEVQPLPATDVDDLIAKQGLQDGFGTLCHSVLENIMGEGNPGDVKCSLCESEEDNARLLSQALEYASLFTSSDLCTKLIGGRKTRQEVRFYTCFEELEDVAVEGVIDLLVFGDKTNLVIDYKTDSAKDPEAHKVQVLTYVKVAEQIYKKPCLGVLFYLRDGSTGPVWDREGNCVELPSSL